MKSPRHFARRAAVAVAAASVPLWPSVAEAGVPEPDESAVLHDTVQVTANLFCGVQVSAYRYQDRLDVMTAVNDTKAACLTPVATYISADYTTTAGDTVRASASSEGYLATLRVDGSVGDIGQTTHQIYWRNAGTVWEHTLTPTK